MRKGYYPDPTGRFEERFWNGRRWTERVGIGGRLSIDPIDIPYAPPRQVQPRQGGDFAAWMRPVAALLAIGSVIVLLVGLVNAGGHVQIGGRDGFILRGWYVIVGSVLMLLGTLGFMASYDEYGRVVGRRAVVPILLISGAVAIWIGLGETPQAFCGDNYGFGCP